MTLSSHGSKAVFYLVADANGEADELIKIDSNYPNYMQMHSEELENIKGKIAAYGSTELVNLFFDSYNSIQMKLENGKGDLESYKYYFYSMPLVASCIRYDLTGEKVNPSIFYNSSMRELKTLEAASGMEDFHEKMISTNDELVEKYGLQEYFTNVLKQKKKVIAHVVNEFQRVYKAKDENVEYEKELNAELAKLQKTRQKYMDMYTDDLISREELNEKIGGSRQEMERIENELKMVSYHLTKGEQLENILNNTFKEIEDITDVHQMTNQQLKRLIQKIEVDKDGNVDIYLRLLGDLGLDESVLIEENETVLNCNDQT